MNPGCLQQFIRRKRWRKRRLFCAFALFWRGICRRSGTQKRERRCRSLFSRLKLQFQTNIPLSTRAFQAHLTAVCIKTHAHVAGFYEAVVLCPYLLLCSISMRAIAARRNILFHARLRRGNFLDRLRGSGCAARPPLLTPQAGCYAFLRVLMRSAASRMPALPEE